MNLEKNSRILVTGGVGFIGKYFVSRLLNQGHEIINLDKLTYAADKRIQPHFYEFSNYSFLHEDIADITSLPECDLVVNFAAESHVDNSIRRSRHFTLSNVVGVQNLLELVRQFSPQMRPDFIQISTDEVYGDNAEGMFDESSLLKPSNPYAATKAAAEHIIESYGRTYGLRYKIVRMSNNFGVRQFPEKLIPRSISRLYDGRKAQLHGDGSYRRTWLHVDDAVSGIIAVITSGENEHAYNLSSPTEMTNRDLLKKILELLDMDFESNVEFIDNRPGQDVRYGIDDSKARAIGWAPRVDFDLALEEIVKAMQQDPHWGGIFSSVQKVHERLLGSHLTDA